MPIRWRTVGGKSNESCLRWISLAEPDSCKHPRPGKASRWWFQVDSWGRFLLWGWVCLLSMLLLYTSKGSSFSFVLRSGSMLGWVAGKRRRADSWEERQGWYEPPSASEYLTKALYLKPVSSTPDMIKHLSKSWSDVLFFPKENCFSKIMKVLGVFPVLFRINLFTALLPSLLVLLSSL